MLYVLNSRTEAFVDLTVSMQHYEQTEYLRVELNVLKRRFAKEQPAMI